MKHIPLRRLTDDDGSIIDWADVIRQVIRRPLDPQRGVDMDEMRRGIRVLDAIEAVAHVHDGEVLSLEDADWEHLKKKTEAMQWGIVDRRIVQFVDDVMGAESLVPQNGLLVRP